MTILRPVSVRIVDGAVNNQVVVKFKSNETVRESLLSNARGLMADGRSERHTPGPIDRLLSAKGLTATEPLFPGTGERTSLGDRFLMSVPTARDNEAATFTVCSFETPDQAAEAAKSLNADRQIEYAHVIQPRYLYAPTQRRRPGRRRAAVDPLLNRQWGLTAVQLFQAQNLTSFKEATEVKIGVVDSGIDSSHPDLQNIFAEERNFTNGTLQDTQGHGTHVSGIIAAVSNNQVGIAGACQSRKLYSLKALGPYDGPGYYRAIRHAISQRLQVVNFSLGGNFDPTEEILIKQALSAGIVIVAAMGNNKLNGNPTSYPAAIDGVIAVGATNEVDQLANFSQTGKHICLVAPGVNILSTVPTYPSSLAATTDYDAWPGTSMATPFVTAAVALMLAKKPTATLAQIRSALESGADPVGGQTEFNNDYGHGRLNIRKALAAL